jgi:hypothetical protein
LLPKRLASPASSQRHNKSLNTGLAIRSRSLFNTGCSQPVKQTLCAKKGFKLMSKKSENAVVGLLIVIGGGIWLFQNHPWWAVILVIVVGIGVFSTLKSSTCDLCSTLLKRNVYTWKIDGKKKRICPNCNRELERRKSKEAISRL